MGNACKPVQQRSASSGRDGTRGRLRRRTAGQGGLTIYIDGAPVGVGEVNTVVMVTAGDVAIGTDSPMLDFASWSVWSTAVSSDVMAVPEWGVPAAGSEAASGIVAAYDFANGVAADLSGNNYPVTVSQQLWHTPCLQLSPGGSASPAAADALNPGGPSPFSFLAWALPAAAVGSDTTYQLVSNGTSSPSFAVNVVTSGASQSLDVARTGVTLSPVPLTAPGQWTHVGVTYDGASFCVYLNGSLQSTTSAPASGLTAITPAVTFGGPGNEEAWEMQGLSVWSVAVDAAHISSYMDGADPTGEEGCLVYCNLMADLGNSTSETVLTVSNAAIFTLDSPMTEGEAQAHIPALAAPPSAPASDEIPLLRVADYKALAAQHGVDVSASAEAPPGLAEAMTWYEKMLVGVPDAFAENLRAEFGHNLQIALALNAQGVRTGTFEVSSQDNQTVVLYHTEDGPQEVGRLDAGLDPYLTWCAQIFFDVMGIIAAMLGIVTTAAKVTKAVGLFDDLFPAIGTAAQNAEGQTAVAKACAAVWEIVKVLWEWKAFFTLIKQLITASWWSVTFTVLGLIAQVAALIASGGWLIAWKVAQMAIAVGALINDLLHMPSPKPELAQATTGA